MMDVKAEKLWLIDQIVKVQDINLLQNIKHLLEQGNNVAAHAKTDFWQDLSPTQQEQVERSIQQLDSGEGITHKDIMQLFLQKYTR